VSQAPQSHGIDLVRRLNTSLLLNILRTHSPQSRADLAKITGLGRTTVSSLVDELLGRGLIHEMGLQPSGGGRPGTELGLNPNGGCAIGIEINTNFILVVLTDFVAQVRWHKRIDVDSNEPGRFIFVAESLIKEALDYNARTERLNPLGIGVGVLGLVQAVTGELKLAPNLHWHNLPLQSMWQSRYGIPVFVENQATAAALGEYYFGAAKDYSDTIFIDASALGIGAGIVLGGKLFKGSQGFAGEAGHMVIDPAGPQCACGNHGCWEAVLNSAAIVSQLCAHLERGEQSIIFDLVQGKADNISLETVQQAADMNDPAAQAALIEASRWMGFGLANLVNIFNPQLIILGGVLSQTIAPYLEIVKQSVWERALAPSVDGVEIKLSTLGTNACVMGTIAVVLDEILREPV
jgi:predicted NBD/HSP70 family sugar kinase